MSICVSGLTAARDRAKLTFFAFFFDFEVKRLSVAFFQAAGFFSYASRVLDGFCRIP